MQLRRVLRARLAPGEQLLGWSAARRELSASTQLLLAALIMVPGIGHGLGVLAMSKLLRFIVLTDSRLLVMSIEKKPVRRADGRRITDLPIGEVEVVVSGERNAKRAEYRIRIPGAQPYWLIVKPQGKIKRPCTRLCRALDLLASDAAG